MVASTPVVWPHCSTTGVGVEDAVFARGRSSVVVVVDSDEADVWIWWVNVGERLQGVSRLCGAWELKAEAPGTPKVLESLVFGRLVMATGRGKQALTLAGVKVTREVDVVATVHAALAARTGYQKLFDEEQASRPPSTRMKAPSWPDFPDPLDLENPPSWDVNHTSMDHLDPCLSISHWLDALCSRWEDLEEERLGRPLLRKLGPRRPIPVVTKDLV